MIVLFIKMTKTENNQEGESRFFEGLPETYSGQGYHTAHEAVVESCILVVFQLRHPSFKLGQVVMDLEILTEKLFDLLFSFLGFFLVNKIILWSIDYGLFLK